MDALIANHPEKHRERLVINLEPFSPVMHPRPTKNVVYRVLDAPTSWPVRPQGYLVWAVTLNMPKSLLRVICVTDFEEWTARHQVNIASPGQQSALLIQKRLI